MFGKVLFARRIFREDWTKQHSLQQNSSTSLPHLLIEAPQPQIIVWIVQKTQEKKEKHIYTRNKFKECEIRMIDASKLQEQMEDSEISGVLHNYKEEDLWMWPSAYPPWSPSQTFNYIFISGRISQTKNPNWIEMVPILK